MGDLISIEAADGHSFQAYFTEPSDSPCGGIIVIQEIFGINSHICDVADRFSKLGYVAAAPALFDRIQPNFVRGYSSEEIAEGQTLKAQANDNLSGVMLDIDATRKKIANNAKKIGIVGFCWGGVVAWLASTRLSLDAAASYYGGGLVPFINEKPNCPVIFHFGSKDTSIPIDIDVKLLRQTQPDCPIYIYPADHGFNCDMRPQYNANAAQVSNMRTIRFFDKLLHQT